MIYTIKSHWLTIPLFFITKFAFGYHAVPLFVWLYIPTILLYTRHNSYRNLITAYIITSIALVFGHMGIFRMNTVDGPRFPRILLLISSVLTINTIPIIALLTDRFIIKHGKCIYTRVFFFPSVWTALWFLLGRFGPLGDYPVFSTALIHWADFSQAASLGGRATLDFLIALTGTAILEIPSYPLHVLSLPTANPLLAQSLLNGDGGSATTTNKDEKAKKDSSTIATTTRTDNHHWKTLLLHPVSMYLMIMVSIFTYGGISINIRRGSFYQASFPDFIPKAIPVGCIVGPDYIFMDLRYDHDLWFNKTIELAEAGAKLILWSETVVNVRDEKEEKEFLERAKKLAIKYGIYLGVTYELKEPVFYDKLVLITKEGKIGIDYRKAYPVPILEVCTAGPNLLQYVDTQEFGRIGGGICFDFSHPHFIKQASTNKIDLMLQPSWTWGPIGTHQNQGNIVRAVENGFTLLKCGSQGVSGVYEPTLNGLFNQKVATSNVEQYLFNLPLQKRAATLYGYIGDTFSYLCMLASTGMLLNTCHSKMKRGGKVRI